MNNQPLNAIIKEQALIGHIRMYRDLQLKLADQVLHDLLIKGPIALLIGAGLFVLSPYIALPIFLSSIATILIIKQIKKRADITQIEILKSQLNTYYKLLSEQEDLQQQYSIQADQQVRQAIINWASQPVNLGVASATTLALQEFIVLAFFIMITAAVLYYCLPIILPIVTLSIALTYLVVQMDAYLVHKQQSKCKDQYDQDILMQSHSMQQTLLTKMNLFLDHVKQFHFDAMIVGFALLLLMPQTIMPAVIFLAMILAADLILGYYYRLLRTEDKYLKILEISAQLEKPGDCPSEHKALALTQPKPCSIEANGMGEKEGGVDATVERPCKKVVDSHVILTTTHDCPQPQPMTVHHFC